MNNFINDDSTLDARVPNPRALVNYFLNDNRERRSYKIERNQSCPCGSGSKYKKCCLRNRPGKEKEEYLRELLELMKFEGLVHNEDEILSFAEQLLDEYPVDPEVLELYVALLEYYDYGEEIIQFVARLAKIRKDEYEDEFFLDILTDIFMEDLFEDFVEIYELKSDILASSSDIKLFYGVSLFETGNVFEASEILESLIDNPGFEEKYSYGVLFEYLFETGNVDQALKFYYDNFRKIAAEKDNNDNMSLLLSFFDGNLDFNKIDSKSDEDDLLKFIIKSLISPLEFYNKFNDMAEVPVKWYLLWDKYDKAVEMAEAIVEQAEETGEENELSLEFYYYYAFSLYNNGEETAAIELLAEKSSDYLVEDLPDIGQVSLKDNPIFKVYSILIYNYIQSDQQEKAVKLMTEFDSEWLLQLLAEYKVEYIIDWNENIDFTSLIEVLLDNIELFPGLSDKDIYSFYYWSMSENIKYFIIYAKSQGDDIFEIKENLSVDNNYDYNGLAFKYYKFLKNNFDKFSFKEFKQKEFLFLEELINQKQQDLFDSRIILDCICWRDKSAREIVNYIDEISEELLYNEEDYYRLFANIKAEYEDNENNYDELTKPQEIFNDETFNIDKITKIGIFLLRYFNKILRENIKQSYDNYEINDFIDKFNDQISDPAAEILFKINSDNDKQFMEGLRNASDYKEELTPILLGILEDTANKIKVYEEHPDSFNFEKFSEITSYAMLLLAEFKEKLAFPLILDIFSVSEERVIYYLLGDILTDDGAAILSSVYDGDLPKLKETIENPELYEFSRVAVFNSLIALVANNKLSIDKLPPYFKYLFDGGLEKEKSFLWDQLVINTARFGFDDLKDEVNNSLENYTEGVVRNYDNYEEIVEEFGDYKAEMENFEGDFYYYQDIESAADLLEKWVNR